MILDKVIWFGKWDSIYSHACLRQARPLHTH